MLDRLSLYVEEDPLKIPTAQACRGIVNPRWECSVRYAHRLVCAYYNDLPAQRLVLMSGRSRANFFDPVFVFAELS
jgi:hypothetical protein